MFLWLSIVEWWIPVLSQLFLIIADIFMTDFEERALPKALARPMMFKQYVDDTVTSLTKQHSIILRLNCINNKFQFTLILQNILYTLAFLDVLVKGNLDNTARLHSVQKEHLYSTSMVILITTLAS